MRYNRHSDINKTIYEEFVAKTARELESKNGLTTPESLETAAEICAMYRHHFREVVAHES